MKPIRSLGRRGGRTRRASNEVADQVIRQVIRHVIRHVIRRVIRHVIRRRSDEAPGGLIDEAHLNERGLAHARAALEKDGLAQLQLGNVGEVGN